MENSKCIERRERVNALAVQAKADLTAIPNLWREVERLVSAICFRYWRPHNATRLYDYDDLYQSAYFGFLKAVNTYDRTRGAFSTFLTLHVRRTCCEVIGQRGKRDPLYDASSLDEPMQHLERENAPVEVLHAPDTQEHYIMVEQGMLVKTILDEVGRLKDKRQRIVIRDHVYKGIPARVLAASMGVSHQTIYDLKNNAVKILRRQPILRAMNAEYMKNVRSSLHESATSGFRKKGVAAFKSDFASVVEDIVMRSIFQ